MTNRDHLLIASALQRALHISPREGVVSKEEVTYDAVMDTAAYIADALEHDNPCFDRAGWLQLVETCEPIPTPPADPQATVLRQLLAQYRGALQDPCFPRGAEEACRRVEEARDALFNALLPQIEHVFALVEANEERHPLSAVD